MVGAPGYYNVTAFLRGALGQSLHPRDERTGCVDDQGRALLELNLDQRRNTMRANHGNLVGANFRGRFDGGHAFAFQAFHFLRVVNQRAQGAHGRANFQRVLNHLNGALDAKTKPEFFS
jgi:hypothetical protein